MPVSAESSAAKSSRDRQDVAGTDLPDCIIASVGKKDVSCAVDCYGRWSTELSRQRRTAVAAETGDLTVARNRSDIANGVDLANAIIARVTDIEIPRSISGFAERQLKRRGGGGGATASRTGSIT